jgi:hypothetical protein
MSFAFLFSGLCSLSLLALVLLAPPARTVDLHIMLGGMGCFFLFMAALTKGPGRHRR